MSVYNSSQRTQVLDPIIDIANNRVEWKLNPNSVYSTQMRVLNLGAVTSKAGGYNKLSGVLSVVKNIYLYDGTSSTLDQVLDANKWLSFKSMNKGHNNSESLNRNMIGNFLGDSLRTNLTIGSEGFKKVDVDRASTGKGILNVAECLPLLKAMKYIPTTIFKDVRLVIEFEASAMAVVSNSLDTISSISNPLLVVDEILDQGLIAQLTSDFRGVGWKAIERDQQNVVVDPSIKADEPKTQTPVLHLRGFDNKYLHRIVMLTTPQQGLDKTDGTVLGGGSLQSVALIKEEYQFVVNGRNKLTGNGITKSSEKLDKLVQTWGEMSISAGGNTTGLYNAADFSQDFLDVDGRQSYLGLSLESFIENLYVNMKFEAQFNQEDKDSGLDRFNSNVNVVVFGECRKSIVMGKDGSYLITYN